MTDTETMAVELMEAQLSLLMTTVQGMRNALAILRNATTKAVDHPSQYPPLLRKVQRNTAYGKFGDNKEKHKKGKRAPMSLAVRRKLSRALKLRWQEAHKAGKRIGGNRKKGG